MCVVNFLSAHYKYFYSWNFCKKEFSTFTTAFSFGRISLSTACNLKHSKGDKVSTANKDTLFPSCKRNFCVHVIADLYQRNGQEGRVSHNARFKHHLVKWNFRSFLQDGKNMWTKLLKSLSLPFPCKRDKSPSPRYVYLKLYKKIYSGTPGVLRRLVNYLCIFVSHFYLLRYFNCTELNRL